MTLLGKGYYIWQIAKCEGGDPNAILAEAKHAGLSHVLIKIADGTKTYNYDQRRRIDLVAPVARLLKEQGITVWGWHYIYGNDPLAEARKAVQRVRELNLDGFVVNAEVEFKQSGKDVAARKYMSELKNSLGDLPVALSSYRFPSYHPQFPFKAFLQYCDYNMPQVYWQGAHNPAVQLNKTLREFQNMNPVRPIIPTGSAYAYGDWKATPADVHEFLHTAKKLGLSAANFWSWDFAHRNLPPVWDRIREFPWPGSPATKDITQRFFEALNAGDPIKIAMMYDPRGVYITAKGMVKEIEKLATHWNTFLNHTFPNASFEITGFSGTGNSRHVTWTATSSLGKILNGNDTFGLRDGKIVYHYSYFKINKKIAD